MLLDITSAAFNMKVVRSKGGTSSWGTALGQGKDYKYSFTDKGEFLESMVYCSVLINDIQVSLGRGSNSSTGNHQLVSGRNRKYKVKIASLFEKVYVNGDILENTKFLLLIVEENSQSHNGRNTLKYNKTFRYKEEPINQDCYDKIAQKINVGEDEGWFISEIKLINSDELHFSAHKSTQTEFTSWSTRTSYMTSILPHEQKLKRSNNIVYHYTSLESAIDIIRNIKTDELKLRATRADCLNDPNECHYGSKQFEDFFHERCPSGLPFILSFCIEYDNPVMWRLYKAKVQLHFNKNELTRQLPINSSCSYVNYIDLSTSAGIAALEKKLNTPGASVNDISTIKHSDWKIEKEWRIVFSETDPLEDLKSNNGPVDATNRYGLMKMYREYSFSTRALVGITIYESNPVTFGILEKQFKDLLKYTKCTFGSDIETIIEKSGRVDIR